MKIGVLTIHRSSNYGAELQAYAMQTFLQQQGYDVSLIDYWPEYRKALENCFSKKNLLRYSVKKKFKTLIQLPFVYRRYKKRRLSSFSFVNKYLHLSDSLEYDVVIYGSDQIWRKMRFPLFKGYDPVYFGSNYIAAKKRVSYAASMGKVVFSNNVDVEFFLALLRNVDAISVREMDLKNFLVDNLGINIPIVCDPVFLLDKSVWESFVDSSYIPSRPYILYYNLQELSVTTRFVSFIQRQTHYSVVEFRGRIPFFCFGKRYRLTADAHEFMSLLSGAAIVVSSSFHGVALSICMEKQFFYACHSDYSNRVESLMNLLNLHDRRIESDFEKTISQPQINYDTVNKKNEIVIRESKMWLLSQLHLSKKL